MYFRLTALWLFWLTFVSVPHNQLNTDGRTTSPPPPSPQPLEALAEAMHAPATVINSETERVIARRHDSSGDGDGDGYNGVNDVDVDVDAATSASTAKIIRTTELAMAVNGQQGIARNAQYSRNRKSTAQISDNFAFDFKANVAKLFANDAPSPELGAVAHSLAPERRHVVPEKLQYTKEISIKQGRLMGIIRNFHTATGLRAADQYLGLPYAEAPVASRRFMPPGTPLPWQGLRIARHLPPVCPQRLPDTSIKGGAQMSRGRYKYLTRLLPYLRNESEDCLYLNVYVPREDGLEQAHPYPVIVFIHGESFEWNSGNAYDGSVLASYGEVIVVTVNYRLGILGFMKPSIEENMVANFGLLDQIAALHWVKENIGVFGGDSAAVTLMGHSSGAACVNYLMVSPVASGLFHRAVLMSGSAMSDWASSNHSLQLTMQIAHGLDCPLNDDNELMLTCLRQKRYQDVLKIPTSFPQFSTSLGPIVDGHVIPNQPYKVMGQHTEHFARYDLLFGVTESEAYHTLGAPALDDGLRENERDNLLRFYMQSRFDVRPDLALAATLKKYNDMYNNPAKATNLEHRDVVLDILSDARVVGPLLQTGLFHADVNRRNYMYVFGHNSAAGPHASAPHSIAGEELAFVFGAPLAPAGPFHNNYSAQEKLLAEAVMAYWTNFAKTGNPKAPWKGTFINLHGLEWDRYDLDWPEFNKRTQTYMNIGIPPSIGYKYRQIYMNFWNKELPDELNQIAAIQRQPYLHTHYASTQMPRGGTSPLYAGRQRAGEVITGHMSKFGTRDNGAEDPVRTLKLLLQEPYANPHPPAAPPSPAYMLPETADNMYNAPPTFGVSRQTTATDGDAGAHTLPTHVLFPGGEAAGAGAGAGAEAGIYGFAKTATSFGGIAELGDGQSGGVGGVGGEAGNVHANKTEPSAEVAKSEATIQLLIGLIVVFIVLNVIIYSMFLLQKRKKRATSSLAMKRKLGGILSYDGATDDELKRSKQTHDGDESYVLDAVRKSNTYEAVKTERSPINGYKMTRQLSTSTVDTHTKVCAWMSAAASSERRLAGTLTRMQNSAQTERTVKESSTPTFSSLQDGSCGNGGGSGTFMQPTHKVSVAVDATPQARGNSVLCQEPIELTRLLGEGRQIIICQDVEVADHELLTPQDSLDTSRYTLQRQHSAATEACEAELCPPPHHVHSCSDPADMYYCTGYNHLPDETVTSFIGDAERATPPDINVTSRDDEWDAAQAQPLSAAEQLSAIKRRNYPKVLPTHTAASSVAAPHPDSPPMTLDLSTTYKRNSLPPNGFLPCFGSSRQPPIPPPRTISTLGRKTGSGRRRNSSNITTSPLMLAQDCTVEEDEPEITQNTLIVGPIVPRVAKTDGADPEGSNYSTLRRLREQGVLPPAEKHPCHGEVGCDGGTTTETCPNYEPNRAPRRPFHLGPLNVNGDGGVQSSECGSHNGAAETMSDGATNVAHHTEKVYAIAASRSAPATPSTLPITATTPLSPLNFSSTPTTPTTPGGSVGHAPPAAKSGIPRLLPSPPAAASAAPPPNAIIAGHQLLCATHGNQAPATIAATTTSTAAAAATATTSRIPQLTRSGAIGTAQQSQQRQEWPNCETTSAPGAEANTTTTTTTTLTTSATAATSTAAICAAAVPTSSSSASTASSSTTTATSILSSKLSSDSKCSASATVAGDDADAARPSLLLCSTSSTASSSSVSSSSSTGTVRIAAAAAAPPI